MKKNLLFVLLAVICTLKVSAQENGKDYEPYPYTFVGLQGGGQVTFTNNSFSNLVRRQYAAFAIGVLRDI